MHRFPPIGKRFALCAAAVALGCCSLAAAEEQRESGVAAFRRNVAPVLKERCVACHGPEKQEADLRLDTLDPDLLVGPDAETWHDVLNKLNLGEMPPQKASPLSEAQQRIVVGWLTEELQRAAEARRNTGGKVVLRRLTRYEYHNTMRDLLGVELDYAADLPPDPPSTDGFQNNGGALGISPLQVELYLDAARKGLQRAIVTGDKPQVYTHRAEESEKVRRVKGEVSNRLGFGDRFLARMEQFPREGEVLVRVHASAVAPPDAPWPRMRVALGVRADVLAPEKTLGEVDVVGTEDKPGVYEFHGRIEDFPLPGHNPKYPGLQITVYNSSDGAEAAKKKQNNKNKKNDDPADDVDPTEPLIVIESVEFEGPLLASWPPPSHARILFESEHAGDEPRYVREVLERFLSRAFRRPATPADIELYAGLYEHLRPRYATLAETMREVLAMALISPEFLYLVEPRQQTAAREQTAREQLSDYELASRLSFFLWSTMPDDRLFELAAAGKLHEPDVLTDEVERMLGDAKSRQFIEHFTNQWFDLAALDRIAVNPEFYPQFDERLKADMRRETQLFFTVILDEDLSCLQLLDADFTLLNHRLAEHYGLAGPRGNTFERVALSPQDKRGGLLTHGSFLLANSNGEDSHPIKRAVWLLERLLDDPPPPPPPDVPELDPAQPDLAGLSLKQQLEMHRRKEACNNCHRGIDPWGVALENYDAVGRWRTQRTSPNNGAAAKRKKPQTGANDVVANDAAAIDASATLPDGVEVNGLAELKTYLHDTQRDRFAEAVVRRLLTYSLGRSLELSDRPTIESLTQRFTADDYRLRKLIAAIVLSEPFQTK